MAFDNVVHLLTRVVHVAEALDSIVIPSGVVTGDSDACPLCMSDDQSEPSSLLVKGFDDFLSLDPSVSAFLSEGPPLIATKSRIAGLTRVLTGTRAVAVGFNQWNERPMPEWAWFEREPKLGALFVTARCRSLAGPPGVVGQCAVCGRQQVKWYRLLAAPEEISIARMDVPADMFLIEGGTQDRGVCITSHGLSVLNGLGYNNLETIELKLT